MHVLLAKNESHIIHFEKKKTHYISEWLKAMSGLQQKQWHAEK